MGQKRPLKTFWDVKAAFEPTERRRAAAPEHSLNDGAKTAKFCENALGIMKQGLFESISLAELSLAA